MVSIETFVDLFQGMNRNVIIVVRSESLVKQKNDTIVCQQSVAL